MASSIDRVVSSASGFRNFLFLTGMVLSVSGCATRLQGTKPANLFPTDERVVAGCAANEQAFDCDRRAILAMQGDYHVNFNFNETVVLKPGYERKDPKHSDGYEKVFLVEDSGNRISLQHILQTTGGAVVKHWRQDWVYESPAHWQYTGDQKFAGSKDVKSVQGTWTQLVYEVNDAPRYSGAGKWKHRAGSSTWTSDRSWRPLPRREYTTRSD